MRTSKEAKNKIKEFEGLRLSAYKCPAGVWTIGYGHTGGVVRGTTITKERADELLDHDLLRYESEISKIQGLTQHQFDALVSFTFNVGIGNFMTSTLRKKVMMNPSNSTIPNEFLKWKYAGGKVLQGLLKRREWEALEYEKG